MNKFIWLLFAAVLFLVFPSQVFAQVVINEVSPYGEWVELFNTSSSEVSMSGCILSMGSATQQISFVEGDIILPLGYRVLKKDVTSAWTGNWLNNSGDTISLSCTGESFTYDQDISGSRTFGRSPNGISNFVVFTQVTEGSENPSPTPVPTSPPSPTPSPSPDPTAQPTSSPSPTKSPSPIPTPTRSPSPKPSSTKSPSSTPQSSGSILGSEDIKTPTASPASREVSESKSPVLAFTLVGAGVVLMGFSGYLAFKKQKETLPQNTI